MTDANAQEIAHSSLPHERALFCDLIAQGLTVASAAQGAGVSRRTPYDWRERDPLFAAAWQAAEEGKTDALETEAYRRALKESDQLLKFLLAARKPEVYSERARLELTGAGGAPLLLPDAELASRVSQLLAGLDHHHHQRPAIEGESWRVDDANDLV